MAEFDKLVREPMEVFWSRDDSTMSDASLSGVPGLDMDGNTRPKKLQATMKQTLSSNQTKASTQEKPKKKHQRSASLKDLCSEDKKRVANLIKELAKVGEEKDLISDQLKTERERFESTASTYHGEKKDLVETISHLEQQQNALTNERQLLQKQFLDTQELLLSYQSKMLSRQEELNESMSELVTNQSLSEGHPVTNVPDHRNQTTPKPQKITTNRPRVRNEQSQPVFNGDTPCEVNYQDLVEKRYTPGTRQYSNYDPNIEYPQYQQHHNQPSHEQFNSHQVYRSQRAPPVHPHAKTRPYTSYIDEHIVGVAQPEGHVRVTQGSRSDRVNSYEPDTGSYGYRTANDYQQQNAASSSSAHQNPRELSHSLPLPRNNIQQSYQQPTSTPATRGHCSQNHGDHNGTFRPEPLLTSTLTEGQQPPLPLSGTQPSRTVGSDYRPLYSDSSLQTTTDNSSQSQTYPPHSMETAIDNNGGKTRGESPISTNFHDHFNDNEFIDYCKRLSPEKRKKELQIQKEALLQEQSRLRRVLLDQEDQLRRQQEKLHYQQISQRQRLQHFEKTGTFPPNQKGYPLAVLPKTPAPKQNTTTSTSRPTTLPKESTSPLSKDQAENTASETEENLAYLTRHGINVTPNLIRSRSRSNESFSKKQHVATSPKVVRSPLRQSSGPGVTNTSLNDSTSSGYRQKQGNLPLQVNRQKTSPEKPNPPPVSDHSMSAIDIIDTLDSQETAADDNVLERTPVNEEAEESKILEEIFFLR